MVVLIAYECIDGTCKRVSNAYDGFVDCLPVLVCGLVLWQATKWHAVVVCRGFWTCNQSSKGVREMQLLLEHWQLPVTVIARAFWSLGHLALSSSSRCTVFAFSHAIPCNVCVLLCVLVVRLRSYASRSKGSPSALERCLALLVLLKQKHYSESSNARSVDFDQTVQLYCL